MLEASDLETMLVELMTGKEPSLRTKEADAVRAQLKKECDEIMANGGTVEIPPEIPHLS